MKKAVQFGAGNIGRGFLGQLFHQSGYQVVFVDINKELISQLNKRSSYPLKIVSDKNSRQIIIDDICAIHVDAREKIVEEIAGADIMATAVGKAAFQSVAPLIARGLQRRMNLKTDKPLNIIICENLFYGAEILRESILKNLDEKGKEYAGKYLGLVESVVSRMVPGNPDPSKDPLLMAAEEYAFLPVARNGFVGAIPAIMGMQAYDNLIARQEQKMFTHNTGHSLCAYLGYLKGYDYIHEAIRDGQISDIVSQALKESGQALVKKYGIDAREHRAYAKNLLERFNNAALNDTVFRGARDPIRKLGSEDRLVGAARLALNFGIKPDCLALGIAAAIQYDDPRDTGAIRLSQMKKEGVDKVLGEVCNLKPNEELSLLIKRRLCQKTIS